MCCLQQHAPSPGLRVVVRCLQRCSAALQNTKRAVAGPAQQWYHQSVKLGSHLAALSSLQSLDLRYSGINVDGATVLGPHLPELSSPQCLRLSRNSIGAVGAAAFGPHFAALLLLQRLDLGYESHRCCQNRRARCRRRSFVCHSSVDNISGRGVKLASFRGPPIALSAIALV